MKAKCLIIVALLLLVFPLTVDSSDAVQDTIANDESLPITYVTYFDPIASATIAKTVPSMTPYKGDFKPLVIPSTVVIDEVEYEVKIIGESSFANWNITSITIPDTVTKIEKNAFMGCSKVKEIHLNGNLTGEKHSDDDTEKDIAENAFCLGDEKTHAECDIYGLTPTRPVWDVEYPYEDIFGKYTTVHFKDLSVDSKDSIIHILLICVGVAALLYMGRCVKVKKIKRKKVKKKR